MRKDKRLEYLILNDLWALIPIDAWPCLCNWCKYVEWEGCSCETSFPICRHPIQRIRDHEEYNDSPTYEGADCWGFQPMYKQQDCVDVVGMWLQGIYVDFGTIPVIGKKG